MVSELFEISIVYVGTHGYFRNLNLQSFDLDRVRDHVDLEYARREPWIRFSSPPRSERFSSFHQPKW